MSYHILFQGTCRKSGFALLLALLGACVAPNHAAEVAGPDWPLPISAAQRPGTYWWCPGSAFTKADIDDNLEQLRAAGFGFAHIIPIYGARGAEDRAIPYLSPAWCEMLDHAVRKARELGLFIDMTTGSGWCFGGPGLPSDAIDVRAKYDTKSDKLTLAPAMKVKRAAPGGEGPMLNPFSPKSMELYLQRFSQAFTTERPALPRAQYHDSFEYQSDWCPELFDEFQARHGYDLRPRLAPFFAGAAARDADTVARWKYDYRLTLSELHRESIARWTRWANAFQMVTRNQAHGAPANLLDIYAAADIPETEMFGAPEFPIPGFRRDPQFVRPGDSDPRICMLAASAAHVAHAPGKQLVTSESGTWLREHWHESLPQIKLELDLFFLAGVNQLLFHGTCYSPQDAAWPGWFFYAATKMDWRNAIWRDVRYLSDYVARCQSVLQAGQPRNDVLLYWPIADLWMNAKGTTIPCTVHRHDWLSQQRFGEVAQKFLDRGVAFDFISDRMIDSLTVAERQLVAPGGRYQALVVPECKYIPAETLARLALLQERGARIFFEGRYPADVPGWSELERRRGELSAAQARLEKFGAVVAKDLLESLAAAGVARETLTDRGLRFIRRQSGGDTWYFVANHTANDFDGWLPLATKFAEATLLDPRTGAMGRAASRKVEGQGEVYLQLPAGATILVQAGANPLTNRRWPNWQASGQPQTLSGPWSVEFVSGGPELPAAYALTELASWTAAPDKKAQAFAGTAKYTLRFAAPAEYTDGWLLDLGDVRDSARVRLNGRDVGGLIALPFQIRIGPLLKPGENLLEIEVTNLSANRIRDLSLRNVDWKVMKDINIVNVDYKPFDATKWPIEPSGLLGPVRLIPRDERPLRP